MAHRVTLALDRYDRHVPFFTGQLEVPGDIDLVPLEVGMAPPRRHGIDRHGRMIHHKEFDAAELSLASYIIARTRGEPLTAIPIFPRRLFSQNHIFVSEGSDLRHPSQLAGKRVVVWAFQVTMSVLAKGDMQRDYGLDWRCVEWLTMHPEEVAVPDLPIRQLPQGADPIDMLLSGEADAFIHPHPPHRALSGTHGIRRLFEDPADECERYYRREGFLPIMHLVALQKEAVRRVPELPRLLMRLWQEAKSIADNFHHDPGYGILALGRLTYERQAQIMARDVWPSGLSHNRRDLERFVGDMVDQRLLDQPVPVEELFHESVRQT
jgi:4,5-dihydroxyphthalate decarboxylase